MHEKHFDCVIKNDERGMGENVGAVTALEYATRKKIVERYGKKCQEAVKNISCLFMSSFSVNSEY